jgi:hypothetical protein
MMKKNRIISTLFAAIALLLTFTLCTKKDPTTTLGADAVTFKAFLDKNGPKAETFSFVASQSFTVTTSKGTTIVFPANSLLDETGKPVTNSVEVSVTEVQKPSEMLLADKPTLGGIDGVMLVSYGEIKVDAKRLTDRGATGNPLKLQDSVRLNVNMAFVPNAAQIRQMPMWKADTVATTVTSGLNSEGIQTTVTTSVPAMKGATWTSLGLTAVTNTTTNKVNFPLDKLGEWRNCDAFYADTRPKTTVLGYFATNYNKEVTTTFQGFAPSSLFFKPKGQNILVKLSGIIVAPTAGKEGFYSYENTIPIGMEGTFVAMSVIDGKFYADVKDVTIANSAGKTFMGISFSPVEVTEADLLAKIALLNSK